MIKHLLSRFLTPFVKDLFKRSLKVRNFTLPLGLGLDLITRGTLVSMLQSLP